MWSPDPSIIITAEQKAITAAAAARLTQFPNLEPDAFWFVVRASGYEPDLLGWVGAMNDPGNEVEPNPAYDPVAWAEASAKLQFAKYFERDHPFIEAARVAIDMTVEELDALWVFAAG